MLFLRQAASRPTGTVKLAFQAEYTRFTDLADPSFTQYEH
jgi:replicative DNA helicase